MTQSSGQSFEVAPVHVDPTLNEPTAQLLVESISRLKAACAAPVGADENASGALGHVGPFNLVCEIASGGMATVYLAINRGLEGFEKFVAVKRIHPHLAQDRQFYEMFIDEARIAALVSHPYVCSVFDFGRADHSYYIAMEFLQGEPISKILAATSDRQSSDARFPQIVARIIANLAEGLHAAHTLCDQGGRSLDLIHRDMTPQNLFVLYDGTVRITDFGIARARHRLHHTQGERVKGKLSYMSPEQLQGTELDQRVDIWSLGVVMWEMLTGRKLFRTSSEGETVVEIMARRIPRPSEFNPLVPAELDQIVLTALARDRAERYSSACALSRALEQYLTHSADSVHAMDVAEWLNRLFPTGAERGRELLELARAAAAVQHLGPTNTLRGLPFRSPLRPMAATDYPKPEEDEPTTLVVAPFRDSLGSIPSLTIEPPDRSNPATFMPTLPAYSLQKSRSERVVAFALSAGIALVGLGVLRSLIRQLPPATHTTSHSSAQLAAGLTTRLRAPVKRRVLAPQPKAAPEAETQRVTEPPLPTLPQTRPRSWNKPAHAIPPVDGATATSTTGTVYLTTPGLSAEVFEGEHALGRTPRQLELTPGWHTLVLKTGDSTRVMTVKATAGATAFVSASLLSKP